MITMPGSPRLGCDGLTRRETLKVGALSLLGIPWDLELPDQLGRPIRLTGSGKVVQGVIALERGKTSCPLAQNG